MLTQRPDDRTKTRAQDHQDDGCALAGCGEEFDSLLDQIRPLAEDGDFDPRHRLSVRADIKGIKDATSSERWPPGTIAIFSCSGRDLYEEMPLPRRVPEQVMVDATPLARPMLAVLGEYCRACVVVLDRESSRVWEMYQDEVREVEAVTDPPHKAGNTESRPEDPIQRDAAIRRRALERGPARAGSCQGDGRLIRRAAVGGGSSPTPVRGPGSSRRNGRGRPAGRLGGHRPRAGAWWRPAAAIRRAG